MRSQVHEVVSCFIVRKAHQSRFGHVMLDTPLGEWTSLTSGNTEHHNTATVCFRSSKLVRRQIIHTQTLVNTHTHPPPPPHTYRHHRPAPPLAFTTHTHPHFSLRRKKCFNRPQLWMKLSANQIPTKQKTSLNQLEAVHAASFAPEFCLIDPFTSTCHHLSGHTETHNKTH